MTSAARCRLQSLIDRAGNQLAEMDQLFLDVAYWNEHVRQPHEALLDADPDGTLGDVRTAICTWMTKAQARVDAAAGGPR